MPEDKKLELSKKYGPLTGKGWLLTGAGLFGVYYIYRRIHGASGSSAGSSTALTGGTTIPTGNSVTNPSPASTFQQSVDQGLSALTGSGLSPTDAYNAIQNWINGVCLTTTQYSALGSYINSAGTPPGYSSSLPPLTVCGNSGSTSGTGSTSSAGSGSGNTTTSSGPPGAPPGLPSSLASAMLSNGEHIVGQAWDPVYQDWVYLTNKGGIYNLNATGGQGNGFMGSIFNLPNNHANWFNAAGQQIRQAERITVNPDGSYTITDTNGETYNFTPGVAASLGIPVPTKPAPTAPAA